MLKVWKGSTRFGYFNGLLIPNYTLANSIIYSRKKMNK